MSLPSSEESSPLDRTLRSPSPRAPRPWRRTRAAIVLVPALLAALPAAVTTARAHGLVEPPQDTFTFSVSSETEIGNDLMRATLVVQGEGEEAAALADEINATMRWALETLAPHESIRRKTSDYRTWPRYDTSERQRLIGWWASQTLELESGDFAAMSVAMATLQERLQVQGTELAVRPETLRRASESLIEEALAAFRTRAELVRTSFGAGGYRVLEVDIDTGGSGADVMMRSRTMAAESADAGVSEPGIAAGSSRVSVQVRGRVRLEGMP